MDRIDAMAASLRDLIKQGVDALQRPSAAGGELQDAEAHRFLALFETLYLVAAADQHLDDTERTEMIQSMSNLVDGRLSDEHIDSLLRSYGDALTREGRAARMTHLAGVIGDPQQRRLTFLLAATTAYADGVIADEEVETFLELAQAFEIPPEESGEILAQVHAQNASRLKE